MSNQLSPAEVQQLLASIPSETQAIFNKVLAVVAMQAAMIDDLVWQLDIEDSANALQKQVMSPAMTQLAEKLHAPIVQGPSIKEVSDEITKMHTALESAATTKNIFETVLSFALKMTPLGALA
jgi:imidazole glycerol phosphate synthase subunit HisF